MTRVDKIHSPTDIQEAFRIREIVYIDEQHVPVEEEFDEFDKDSCHFLSVTDDLPSGTARWRKTNEGYKLERFAVLKEFRGRGIGSALVQAVIADIRENGGSHLYLNAQVDAMPLYKKFGFKKIGQEFLECDIRHQRMELQL